MKQNECVLFEGGVHGWTDHASVGSNVGSCNKCL